MDYSDLSVQERVLLGLDNEDTEINEFDVNEDEIELSGRTARNFARISKAMKKKGNKRTISRNAVKKEIGASKKRMQVLERVHTLPENWQKDLINGVAQLSDKVLYSGVKVASITGNKLITTDGGEATGIRNFSNGKYKYPFLLQGIQLLFDDKDLLGTYDKDLPAEIANGVFTIINDAKTLIGEMPVLTLTSVNGYSVDEKFNYFELENPKWIAANTDVQAALDFAAEFTTGYLKILFYGTEVRPH